VSAERYDGGGHSRVQEQRNGGGRPRRQQERQARRRQQQQQRHRQVPRARRGHQPGTEVARQDRLFQDGADRGRGRRAPVHRAARHARRARGHVATAAASVSRVPQGRLSQSFGRGELFFVFR